MQDHWRRLSLRNMSRFVAVAAIVAVVGVMIGREAGIGQQTGASVAPSPADESPHLPQQQSEETAALTLTLSAPEICETERGEGFAAQEYVYDDEGEIIGTRSIHRGWANVAETPVRWLVTGGTGPYTLVIDNETRDGFSPYEGATGTASVSCALNPGDITYADYDQHRWYLANPEVDSGPKTLRATVTDATGTSAEASTNIYVILVIRGDCYRAPNGECKSYHLGKGKTYRVRGHLMTMPANATTGSSYESHGESGFTINFYANGFRGIIGMADDTGEEHGRRIEPYSAAAQSNRAEHEDHRARLNSSMTNLITSIGQPPVSAK